MASTSFTNARFRHASSPASVKASFLEWSESALEQASAPAGQEEGNRKLILYIAQKMGGSKSRRPGVSIQPPTRVVSQLFSQWKHTCEILPFNSSGKETSKYASTNELRGCVIFFTVCIMPQLRFGNFAAPQQNQI